MENMPLQRSTLSLLSQRSSGDISPERFRMEMEGRITRYLYPVSPPRLLTASPMIRMDISKCFRFILHEKNRVSIQPSWERIESRNQVIWKVPKTSSTELRASTVRWIPDSNLFSVNNDRRVIVVDLETLSSSNGIQLRGIKDHKYPLTKSSLLGLLKEGNIELADFRTGNIELRVPQSAVSNFVWCPTNSQIVAAEHNTGRRRYISTWDVRHTVQPVNTVTWDTFCEHRHFSIDPKFKFDEFGKSLIVRPSCSEVHIWDHATGKRQTIIKTQIDEGHDSSLAFDSISRSKPSFIYCARGRLIDIYSWDGKLLDSLQGHFEDIRFFMYDRFNLEFLSLEPWGYLIWRSKLNFDLTPNQSSESVPRTPVWGTRLLYWRYHHRPPTMDHPV